MRRGIILVEIIMIVAIIAILAAIAVPKFKELWRRSEIKAEYSEKIKNNPYNKKELEAERDKKIGDTLGEKDIYEVYKLFSRDGCDVYRFFDNGRYHYFTSCIGGTMSEQKSGKFHYPEEVPTELK